MCACWSLNNCIMFSCHTMIVQLLGHSNVEHALVNHPGVKYGKKSFFFPFCLFFYFCCGWTAARYIDFQNSAIVSLQFLCARSPWNNGQQSFQIWNLTKVHPRSKVNWYWLHQQIVHCSIKWVNSFKKIPLT